MFYRAKALILLGLIGLATAAHAETSQTSFDLLTDASVLNHYPGPDDLIGTADDIVSDQPAGFGPSDPNGPAALSYFTVKFFGSVDQQDEFQGDVIRFQTGGLDVEATDTKEKTFDVRITGGTLEGTVANPFVGRSITTLGEQAGAPDGLEVAFPSNQATGIFDHSTATPDIEEGTGIFPFPDQEIMSATVVVVKKDGFGASGDAYMDNVVAPLITSEDVTGIIRIEFVFTEVQEPDTGLNGAIIQGVLVASTTDAIPQLTQDDVETPTPSFTLTVTPSPTRTLTNTPSLTGTNTPILTSTFTLTPSPTETLEQTETRTPTLTETIQALMTCSADLDQDDDIDYQDLLIFIEQLRAFRGTQQ